MKFDINWESPAKHRTIKCIEAHTGGEPLRVIYSGFPELAGKTVLEKRHSAQKDFDHMRRALMWEPRGHADMYGCILIPPERVGSNFGVLFTHNEGFSTMCGHGIIAVTTVALETGLLPINTHEVRIDSPAGLIKAYPRVKNNRVESVSFDNVSSFVANTGSVDIHGLGTVQYTIAFGGAFYAYVDADKLGLELIPENAGEVILQGRAVKKAVMAKDPMQYYPFEKDLNFLYGTIFISRKFPAVHSRNACVFAEGELDRSPTGTGVCGRAAIHFTEGELKIGESITIESIIGSRFSVKVIEQGSFGEYKSVVPRVTGNAFICGKSEWIIDPDDDLKYGFLLR